jgi:4'-phosphopantetheinyl transferase
MTAQEVHVWSVSLDPSPARIADLWGFLSAEEKARAMAFRFEADRVRFIAARGTLRLLVGRYLGRSPAALPLRRGPWGKPCLGGGGEGLHFNLSHAGDLMLLAVARGREVGVDVERLDANIDAESLARTALSTGERAALMALPRRERAAALIRAWTRKEAVMKATGRGASLSPDRVEVSLEAEADALIGIDGDRCQAARWSLRDLSCAETCMGAVAAAGRGWRVVLRGWGHGGRGLPGLTEPPRLSAYFDR